MKMTSSQLICTFSPYLVDTLTSIVTTCSAPIPRGFSKMDEFLRKFYAELRSRDDSEIPIPQTNISTPLFAGSGTPVGSVTPHGTPLNPEITAEMNEKSIREKLREKTRSQQSVHTYHLCSLSLSLSLSLSPSHFHIFFLSLISLFLSLSLSLPLGSPHVCVVMRLI